MSMSFVKLALNALGSPTSVAVLGSVGAHVLLGASLPALSVFSQGQPGPSEVPLVELTPEELARVPSLEPAPAIPFVPPASTQLLPLPKNFELPSVSQKKSQSPAASIPSTPSKPSSGAVKPSPSISIPDRIVTRSPGGGKVVRRRGLTPGLPSGRGYPSSNSGGLGSALDRARLAPGRIPEGEPQFRPNPNQLPEITFGQSIEESMGDSEPKPSIEENTAHFNDDEITALSTEDSTTKTPAGNTQGTEETTDPASENSQQSPTPEAPTEQPPGTRGNTPQEAESEQNPTPSENQSEPADATREEEDEDEDEEDESTPS
ncbi:MAG: hypothetical protein SW833_27630, partial [Cyanobacteriota bacterium]|nr:hypothetical protein [Cyanobacteriota bacterium]